MMTSNENGDRLTLRVSLPPSPAYSRAEEAASPYLISVDQDSGGAAGNVLSVTARRTVPSPPGQSALLLAIRKHIVGTLSRTRSPDSWMAASFKRWKFHAVFPGEPGAQADGIIDILAQSLTRNPTMLLSSVASGSADSTWWRRLSGSMVDVAGSGRTAYNRDMRIALATFLS
jgi:hypothetical protein